MKPLLYSVLCIASTVLIGWRINAIHNRETQHFEIVEDLSLSHPNGCGSLLGLAESVLRSDGASPESTLTILIVGDATTANEPWQLGRYVIPVTRKVIEGHKVTLQQEVLRDISGKCGMTRRTNVSPIFLAVKQAVADLRAQGCKESSGCQLLVDSDLEDNVETYIEKGLKGLRSDKRYLPSPIKNDGIEIVFCGLAVTAGHIVDPSSKEIRRTLPRNPGREDRLRQIWLSLFTRPEAVRVEPYCPKPSDDLAAIRTGR